MRRRFPLVAVVLLWLFTMLGATTTSATAAEPPEAVNWGQLDPGAPYVSAADPKTQFDVYLNLIGPNNPEVDALRFVVPAQPDYRKWLTLDQATAAYGADAATQTAIQDTVEGIGGTVRFGPGNTYAALSLTIEGAEQLFGVPFGVYGQAPCLGLCDIAPTGQPELPAAWDGLVDAVGGLLFPELTVSSRSDAPVHPLSSTLATPTRTGTPSGCAEGLEPGGFTPSQLNTAYGVDDLQAQGLTGAGVRLAVLELGGNVRQSDLDAFTSCFDLPSSTVRQVNVAGTTTPNPAWLEATLDVQVIAQVAPGLEAFDLYSYNNLPTAPRSAFLEMLASPLEPDVYGDAPPDIVSVSYGLCEAVGWAPFSPIIDMAERMLALASSTGMSYVVASGDSGSSGCLHNGINNQVVNPSYPSTSAWVTAVGGTSLTLAADNSIVGESVWNDTLFPPPYFRAGAAGTGATSGLLPRPAWQIGSGVPGGDYRSVPDVALYAGTAPGWTIRCSFDFFGCNSGAFLTVGGTSAATPLFAGMLALLAEPVELLGQPPVGLSTPLIYDLAAQGSQALRDVTTGNNAVAEVDCCTATPDYDVASGWGSVNIATLVSELLGPDGPPTNLQVLNGYQGTAITFNAPESSSAPISNYEFSTDDGATWTAFNPPTGNTVRSVVINGLPNGVTTPIRLRAVNAAGPGPASESVIAEPVGAVFTAIDPVRVFDSRSTGAGGPLQPGEPRTVAVNGPGALPAGAIAAAYNVTVTGTQGSGYIVVGPSGTPLPDTSTLNWTAPNQTLANGYVSAINFSQPATNGTLQVVAQGGQTDVVLDLVGYYATEAVTPVGSVFTPITPERVYDSRQAEGALNGGQQRVIDVTAAVPQEATAVAFTLTQTGTTGTGFLTVSPTSQMPATSTLNWTGPGQTIANSSVVGVDGGQIVVAASGQGSAEFVVDILGYYASSSVTPDGTRFTAIVPGRAYDSRLAQGPIAGGQSRTTGVLVPQAKPVNMPQGLAAVAFNVTVTGTGGSGFLYVAPAGTSGVAASTINWSAPLTTRANGSVVAVSEDSVTTFAEGGSTQYLIDIAGYFN